jgi:mannosyltransferase
VAVPPVLAAILCVIGITSRSLGFDEGATVSIASQHGAALWHAIARDGGNMSGYYLFMHVLIAAFGNGLFVLRVSSAVAAVAAVALLEAVADRLFGRRVALIAGVLTAVSLPLVYWAQTARSYAPMVAFACAGFLAFIALCDPRDGRAGGRSGRGGWGGWAWVLYVVAMTLAMYCSIVAVLVVPAQLVVLARRRRALARLATALGALVVLCAPLAYLAIRRGSGQLFWVPRPSRMIDTQVLDSLTSAGLQPSFTHTATTYVLLWATVVALSALALDVLRRQRRGEPVWARALTLAWAVGPAILTFVYSLVAHPMFVPRNLLSSTPAVGLALAVGLADRRLPRAVAAGALVLIVGMRAQQVHAAYGVSPEPWQQVTADVLSHARPGDCVAFYPEDGRMAFQYYVGTGAAAIDRAPRSVLPVLRWGVVKPFVEDYATLSSARLGKRVAGCRRMWFIASHEGQVDGPQQSRINRARYLALGAELAAVFGAAPRHSFGYADTIHVTLMSRGTAGGQGRNVKP